MSIFDTIAKTFKAKTKQTGASLFDAIGNYFAPVAGKTRVRDVVREIPKANARKGVDLAAKGAGAVGDAFLEAGAKFATSLGEVIPRVVVPEAAGKIQDPQKLPGFLGEIIPKPVTSYQTDVSKRMAEGQSGVEAVLKTSGQIALDEPLGVALKPLAVVGSIAYKTVGKEVIEGATKVIAKSKKVTEIVSGLKKFLKGTDEEIEDLANGLKDIDDPKVVKQTIEEVTQKAETTKQAVAKQDDELLLKLEEMRPEFDKIRNGQVDLEGGTIADDAIDQLKKNKLTPETRLQAQEALKLLDTQITKERGFATSVKNAPDIAPEIKAGIDSRYAPITNKETVEQALKLIDNNVDEAYRIAKSTRPASAFDNTVSQLLVKRIQDEAKLIRLSNPSEAAKLFDEAIDIVENVARKATSQGQAIQSLSIFNRLTPEGVLNYTQRQINKANELIPNPAKKIKLTQQKVESLTSAAEKIQKLPEGEEKIIAGAVLIKEIQDMIPSSILSKISATQTMLQLLNPKTIIRNLVGNAGFATVEQISDVVGSVLDTSLSLITGKRTKVIPSFRAQTKGAVEGFRSGIRDALKGIDTGGVATQFDLPKTSVFKGKVGKAAQKLLDTVLKGPDRAFFQAAYDGSLYQQMKAAGVSEPTEAMKEIAHFDGMYRTFQDENATTYLFQTIKKSLNLGKEFGIGDFVLKYPKTPANLLNRGLAYSPAGFVGAALELAKPLMGKGFNQKGFVEASSRALTGSTMMYGTGAFLHRLGIITTQRDPNKDVAQAQKEVGLGQYKFNVSALKRFVMGGFDPEVAKLEKGDTLVSYDWFQPLAIAIALGADYDKNKGDKVSLLSDLVSGVAASANTLAEQPLVSGLTTPLKFGNLSDAGIRVIESIPASFVPTLANQVRQLKDNTVRNSYDPDVVTYALNLAENKIPGLSERLPAKYGTFGQKQELYQGNTNSLFNVLFNPSFVTKYNPTSEAKMVLDIYQNSGEKKQLPNVVSTTQTVNGKSRKLTSKEVTNLQRYIGTTTREIFSGLASSPQFMKLPDEDKAKALSGMISDVGLAGKIIFLGEKPKRSPGATTMGLVSTFFKNNQVKRAGPQ